MGALGALTALALSVACGGEADPSPAPLGSISQTCARFAECLDRAELQADCERDLAEKRTSATEVGCTTFYDEFLSCDEQHPGTCDPNVGYGLAPECSRAVDAVDDCIRDRRPPQCSLGTPPCTNPPCLLNSCDIDCGDFAADCSGPPGQPMSCVCTKGARTGQAFSTADCGSMVGEAPRICR
jgi:hypothetical protein